MENLHRWMKWLGNGKPLPAMTARKEIKRELIGDAGGEHDGLLSWDRKAKAPKTWTANGALRRGVRRFQFIEPIASPTALIDYGLRIEI